MATVILYDDSKDEPVILLKQRVVGCCERFETDGEESARIQVALGTCVPFLHTRGVGVGALSAAGGSAAAGAGAGGGLDGVAGKARKARQGRQGRYACRPLSCLATTARCKPTWLAADPPARRDAPERELNATKHARPRAEQNAEHGLMLI